MADEFERDPRPDKREAAGTEPEKQTNSEQDGGRMAVEDRIRELEAEIRAKSEEAAKNYELYLRERAESENFRKRLQRDKAEAIRFSNEGIVRDILPLLDNLERAAAHAELGGNGKSVVEGIQLIVRMFREVLERYGVKPIEVVAGAPFDPVRHEAAGLEMDPEFPPNTVIRLDTKGYQLHERLLRPARVIVSGARKEEDQEKESREND